MYNESQRNAEDRLSCLQYRYHENVPDRLVMGHGAPNEEGSHIYKLDAFGFIKS